MASSFLSSFILQCAGNAAQADRWSQKLFWGPAAPRPRRVAASRLRGSGDLICPMVIRKLRQDFARSNISSARPSNG